MMNMNEEQREAHNTWVLDQMEHIRDRARTFQAEAMRRAHDIGTGKTQFGHHINQARALVEVGAIAQEAAKLFVEADDFRRKHYKFPNK